jgi:hypothetical protein
MRKGVPTADFGGDGLVAGGTLPEEGDDAFVPTREQFEEALRETNKRRLEGFGVDRGAVDQDDAQ